MLLVVRKSRKFKTKKAGEDKAKELKAMLVNLEEKAQELADLKKTLPDGLKTYVANAYATLDMYIKKGVTEAPQFKSVSFDEETKTLVTDKFLENPAELKEDEDVDSTMIWTYYTTEEQTPSKIYTVAQMTAKMDEQKLIKAVNSDDKKMDNKKN